MSLLRLRGLKHSFGDQENLRGIDLVLNSGEALVIVGPSGSGKSSLLKCIAGYYGISGGEVQLRSQIVATAETQTPPHRRRIGYLFQEPSLFPHMNVRANIEFGLKQHKISDLDWLNRLADQLGLAPLLDRMPNELSGGQMQKVALARALVLKPDLVLMDEPFSSLDEQFVDEFLPQLQEILSEIRAGLIYVTHRLKEASVFAEKIMVLQKGRVVQHGSVEEIYNRPASAEIAKFFGRINFLRAKCEEGRWMTSLGEISVRGQTQHAAGQVFIRPGDILLDESSPMRVRVQQVLFEGDRKLVLGSVESESVWIYAPSEDRICEVGASMGVTLRNKEYPLYIVE